MSEIADNTLIRGQGPILRPSKAAILSRDFCGCELEGIEVRLPVGLRDEDGVSIRRVWLEPLTGRDEEWIERVGHDLSLPRWVSVLLDNKIRWNGRSHRWDQAARLSVADRDILVFYLRILTFGHEIWGVTQCLHKGCGAKIDFTFDLTGLDVPSVREGGDISSASIDYQSKEIGFSYRQPNGSDQEVIHGLVSTQPYRALLELLTRCLVKVDGLSDISPETLSRLPQEVLLAMDRIIAEQMASFDWDIELTCPECNIDSIMTLDIHTFFWEELQIFKGDLWKDVHQLAFYYHWSEADILSLTRWKRKMYLRYIQDYVINSRR